MQHLARGADQLVDCLNHVHWNTDRTRLIGNGTGDGLTDPPGGVCGELVTPAVFELVHRLHQSDIAFLNQIQKLQAPVGIFLGYRDYKAQVGFDHFLLGLTRFALTLLHSGDDTFVFPDGQPSFRRHC